MSEEKKPSGECKYCGTEIHKSNIRCSVCDIIWNAGRSAGIAELKGKLTEVKNAFLNLISYDQH